MNVSDLPVGNAPAPIAYPHFPARWQTFLWRNWGIVAPERLADVLKCSIDEINQAAAELGLQQNPVVNPKWMTHGYLTLIRNNWQLLSYEQILKLLDWTADKLAYTLKEEDFFWHKLGLLKPDCKELVYEPLTAEQQEETRQIKATLQRHFPADQMAYIEPPFAFLDQFAPKKTIGNTPKFDFNYIHAYSASCGDIFANADKLDPVPENLLAQYASMGIKGVWMHALLYLLFPIPGAEEFSEGHEKRFAALQKIVSRCAKYGIKVYLYVNEPRSMPMAFYDKKPSWKGYEDPANNTCSICTTATPEPLEWLENAVRYLFENAKGLGGIFCITMSENITTCQCRFKKHLCPSCKDVPGEKIIADVISAMERGMHSVEPDALMIAYDWAWFAGTGEGTWEDNAAFKKSVIERLPKSVCICTVSEWGMVTNIGGTEQYLVDYSISQVGPSKESLHTWKEANNNGLRTVAKVQINNSWELSAVPYIPVPYVIEEHMQNLKKAGVSGLMLSWTLGGFPGGNLELLNASPDEIAAAKYHPELAQIVCKAWKLFSDAFRQFPFNVQVIYNGPMNFGPMNLMSLEKTNYKATMVGYPYDDLETWRGPYPAETLRNQFKLLTEDWQKGLDLLKASESEVRGEEKAEYEELYKIALAAYCHLRSTYLQISFVMARDNGMDKAVMRSCVEEEMAVTKDLYNIVRNDSRIGFEASNHYYYTLNDLREKIISCESILKKI